MEKEVVGAETGTAIDRETKRDQKKVGVGGKERQADGRRERQR